MDLHAEKLKLVQAVLDIQDVSLLKEVKRLLKPHTRDWFEELTEDQKESVLRGLEQANKGETISHNEAIARLGL
nr:hypothetical protein [Mucilaginibacter sp. L294]